MLVDPRTKRTLFRELKSAKGRISTDQKLWGEGLLTAGADFAFWRPLGSALCWYSSSFIPFVLVQHDHEYRTFSLSGVMLMELMWRRVGQGRVSG